MITKFEIRKAQEEWAVAILKLGTLKNDHPACTIEARRIFRSLYAVDRGDILFKPSTAIMEPFRYDLEGTVSYFVGGGQDYPEDTGFALKPWANVRFSNKFFLPRENRATVGGHYYFMDMDGRELKVEYTMGYIKTGSGKLQIEFHHSSFPYLPKKDELRNFKERVINKTNVFNVNEGSVSLSP